MDADLNTDAPRQRSRRVVGALARVLAIGVAALIGAGLMGQAVRDRWLATALMMYIPLLPLGLAALPLDLCLRGRSLPQFRFGLTVLGGAAIGWSATAMIGHGAVTNPRPGGEEFTLLHWNIQWGGGLFRSPGTMDAQRAAIIARDPDLVAISEAPGNIGMLADTLGPGASHVKFVNDIGSPYWHGLAVCSRWPIRLEDRFPLPGGVAMVVTATVRDRCYRILVVDGQSSPFHSRLPFLHAIAVACKDAAQLGRPYDFVVGDFNTPSRSIGFDELKDQGYRLASRSSSGWRATFPAWFPIYDIDHVWIGPSLSIRSCTLFNGPWSDHRGQIVRVQAGAPSVGPDCEPTASYPTHSHARVARAIPRRTDSGKVRRPCTSRMCTGQP